MRWVKLRTVRLDNSMGNNEPVLGDEMLVDLDRAYLVKRLRGAGRSGLEECGSSITTLDGKTFTVSERLEDIEPALAERRR